MGTPAEIGVWLGTVLGACGGIILTGRSGGSWCIAWVGEGGGSVGRWLHALVRGLFECRTTASCSLASFFDFHAALFCEDSSAVVVFQRAFSKSLFNERHCRCIFFNAFSDF